MHKTFSSLMGLSNYIFDGCGYGEGHSDSYYDGGFKSQSFGIDHSTIYGDGNRGYGDGTNAGMGCGFGYGSRNGNSVLNYDQLLLLDDIYY